MSDDGKISVSDICAAMRGSFDSNVALCIGALKSTGMSLGDAGQLGAAFALICALKMAKRMGFSFAAVQHAWDHLEDEDPPPPKDSTALS